MSFRVCHRCDHVINNKTWEGDACPNCGGVRMIDPLSDNRDWNLLYKEQKEMVLHSIIKRLNREKEELKECVKYFAQQDACGEYGFSKATECLNKILERG